MQIPAKAVLGMNRVCVCVCFFSNTNIRGCTLYVVDYKVERDVWRFENLIFQRRHLFRD